MKYWTLFTLRMMARVGLALSVVVWLSSQWMHLWGSIRFDSVYYRPQTNAAAAGVLWTQLSPVRAEPSWSGYVAFDIAEYPPSMECTYASVSNAGRLVVIGHSGLVEVNHWCVCLTFLIATVATSMRWRKPTTESGLEATDE